MVIAAQTKYNMTIIKYILILLISTTTFFGQTDKKVKMLSVATPLSYTWQGTNSLEFGLGPKLLLDAKKDHSNISLIFSGNLMYYNKAVYLTPTTKLRIMPHKRKKTLHLAWFASVGHSYTNIQNKYDHRITPELGIKWEWYNLSVGYNIPTSTYRDNCTNLFRATFSLNLF